MSLKVHFLFNHLDYFPNVHLGSISEEQEQRFHQDNQEMEIRYKTFKRTAHFIMPERGCKYVKILSVFIFFLPALRAPAINLAYGLFERAFFSL